MKLETLVYGVLKSHWCCLCVPNFCKIKTLKQNQVLELEVRPVEFAPIAADLSGRRMTTQDCGTGEGRGLVSCSEAVFTNIRLLGPTNFVYSVLGSNPDK